MKNQSVHFTHWLSEAERLPYRMADLTLPKTETEAELVFAALRDLERAARCLVADAYVDPDEKLQEAGVCAIRVGTVSFADTVKALAGLSQLADYYRAPLKKLDDDGNPVQESA